LSGTAPPHEPSATDVAAPPEPRASDPTSDPASSARLEAVAGSYARGLEADDEFEESPLAELAGHYRTTSRAEPSKPTPKASISSVAMARLRGVRTRLIPEAAEYRPTGRRRVWLIGMYVLRRWSIEDRAAGLAGLLTVQTLLSTVPMIGVALLVVGLMDDTAGAKLMYDLFRSLVPETDRASEMAEAAMALASNVTIARLGAWGFLVTLIIAFVLFQTLERTFNRIWRVQRRRGVFAQFTMFYTLATLGPLAMLYSLGAPLLSGFSVFLGSPVITTALGLVMINRFLPYARVRWRAAVIGGLCSAILLELAKVGFGIYATRFALQAYEGVYGSLAILPILIIWSYVSWMVILLGAEVTYAVHSHRAIALQGYVNRYVLERSEYQRPTGRTAARIVLAVCDHYARRKIGLSLEALGERFRLGLDHIGELVDALERRGIVIETAEPLQLVIPGRPLDQIRVLDVLAMFDRDHAMGLRDDRLGALVRELDLARAQIMADTTYADLVGVPRGTTVRIDEPDAAAGADP
jgi:membrane protein